MDKLTISDKNKTHSDAFLIALDSCFSNREYALSSKGLTIGRDQELNDIVVADKTISRKHFQIVQDNSGNFTILDLQSTNGIYLNTERVSNKATVKDGDVIGLGSVSATHLRFQLQSNRNQAISSSLPPGEDWFIGRGKKAAISLSFDPTVSSNHAKLVVKKNQLLLVDLNSLNGTFVNGKKVKKTRIQETDTIVIGSSYFHFRLTDKEYLVVSRQECGDDIQLECVGLSRDIAIGRNRTKCILDDIVLQINPGEFVGILGPSGAGKSTLLKALNGHTPPDKGCVILNQTPLYRSYDMFRSLIGYVPQDDILHSELSVEKSLEFVAKLRLPKDTDKEQIRKIVKTTIEDLGLSHVKKNKIEKLSGGQRKRVSIGAELITRPSLLFLDEPTSGLDPSVEERLMYHFQDMAKKGTTILITTHILYSLSMLDKIIFLSQGKLVFYGTPEESMSFFNEQGTNINKATQIFDLLEGLSDTSFIERDPDENKNKIKIKIAEYYAKKFQGSLYFKKNIGQRLSAFGNDLLAENIQKKTGNIVNNSTLDRLLARPVIKKWSIEKLKNCFSPGYWAVLSMRHLSIKYSSLKKIAVYMFIPIILALVTLTQSVNGFPDKQTVVRQHEQITESVSQAGKVVEMQLQVLLSPEGDKSNRSTAELLHALKHEGPANLPIPMGTLLMFVMTSIFMGTFIACQEISSEKPIRFREQMTGQRVLDYIGSKLSFCFSITAVQCTAYLSICYLTKELRMVPFLDILPILIMLAWTSVSLGLLVSSIDNSNGHFSIILAIILVLPQLILSGGLGPDFYEGMSKVPQIISNLFPAKWGLEMLLTASYDHIAGQNSLWVQSFITNIIGFQYGNSVITKNMFILTFQTIVWLMVTSIYVKKLRRN